MVSGKIVFVLFEIQVNVFISNKSIIAQRIHIKCGADKRILRIYGTSFALSELSEFGTADWAVRARGSTHSILKFSRVWMALTCSACVLPRYIEICQQQQQKWARIGIISIGSSSTMCMRTENQIFLWYLEFFDVTMFASIILMSLLIEQIYSHTD